MGRIEEVEKRLITLIAQHFQKDEDKISPSASIIVDLDGDRSDVFEILMKVEEEFGIDLSGGKADDFDEDVPVFMIGEAVREKLGPI